MTTFQPDVLYIALLPDGRQTKPSTRPQICAALQSGKLPMAAQVIMDGIEVPVIAFCADCDERQDDYVSKDDDEAQDDDVSRDPAPRTRPPELIVPRSLLVLIVTACLVGLCTVVTLFIAVVTANVAGVATSLLCGVLCVACIAVARALEEMLRQLYRIAKYLHQG